MLMIYCPHCQERREEEEFSYVSEANIRRSADIDNQSAKEFSNYLYGRENKIGWQEELWVHAMACRKYFQITRNTKTYEIRETSALNQQKSSSDVVREENMGAKAFI